VPYADTYISDLLIPLPAYFYSSNNGNKKLVYSPLFTDKIFVDWCEI